MYKLRYSKASPYLRKVLLAAHHLELREKTNLEVADTSDLHDTLRGQNPTGRILVLIKQDGSALYDSRIILDFLERQSHHLLFPETSNLRDLAQTKAALAESLTDSTILWGYADSFSEGQPSPELWRSHHLQKTKRGCDYLEQNISSWISIQPHTVSSITLAACLSYLSFRNVYNWTNYRPEFLNWYEEIATSLPGFEIIAPDANLDITK